MSLAYPAPPPPCEQSILEDLCLRMAKSCTLYPEVKCRGDAAGNARPTMEITSLPDALLLRIMDEKILDAFDLAALHSCCRHFHEHEPQVRVCSPCLPRAAAGVDCSPHQQIDVARTIRPRRAMTASRWCAQPRGRRSAAAGAARRLWCGPGSGRSASSSAPPRAPTPSSSPNRARSRAAPPQPGLKPLAPSPRLPRPFIDPDASLSSPHSLPPDTHLYIEVRVSERLLGSELGHPHVRLHAARQGEVRHVPAVQRGGLTGPLRGEQSPLTTHPLDCFKPMLAPPLQHSAGYGQVIVPRWVLYPPIE